jgi:hypothetical protein
VYVKRRLNALNSNNLKGLSSICFNTIEDKRLFKKFVNNYLKEDGVLVLRLLSRNSQDLIVSELISNLFNLYKNHVKQQRINSKTKNITQLGQLFNLDKRNTNINKNTNYSNENELQHGNTGIIPKQTDFHQARSVNNSTNNASVIEKELNVYPNQN